MDPLDDCCVSCVFFNDSIGFCLFVAIEKLQLGSNLLDIHVRKVLNSTKECIDNCFDYVIAAFGYNTELGTIIGSGIKVKFGKFKDACIHDRNYYNL